MKKVITETASRINDHRANITFSLLGISAVLAFFYAFNLYSLVSRTVAIGQIEKQIVMTSSAISALDNQYLKLFNAITPDVMSDYGLTAGEVSMYITRPSRTASIGNLASGGHEL